MKKELLRFLLFLTFVLTVGLGVFVIGAYGNGPLQLLWTEYQGIFAAWILGFLTLGTIRLVAIRATTLRDNLIPESDSRRAAGFAEISSTLNYTAVGVLSIALAILISVVAFFPTESSISPNLLEAWIGYRPILIRWFLGYILLCFARIVVSLLFTSQVDPLDT